MIIQARNVNEAYTNALWYMKSAGVREHSRLGSVLVAPNPVMTVYHKPMERVLFDVERHANPFFHLAECIWMMAGSNDAQWIGRYNKQMLAYSDNGHTLHGAYGDRWRNHWPMDQLFETIERLQKNPLDRKVVMAMWDPDADYHGSKGDIPCNTHIYFRVVKGALDMTTMCRSNDIIWGAYGANAVHFSFMQEVVAAAIGCPVGMYYQFSNNWHIYEHHWPLLKMPFMHDPYAESDVAVRPLLQADEKWQDFLKDCQNLVEREGYTIHNRFLQDVAIPMLNIWEARKAGNNYDRDLAYMPSCDWKLAAFDWLRRADILAAEKKGADEIPV